MHYIAMMVVVAAISLYGSGASSHFKHSYSAAVSGEFGEAVGHAATGIRHALREADPAHDPRAFRFDARYDGRPRP